MDWTGWLLVPMFILTILFVGIMDLIFKRRD